MVFSMAPNKRNKPAKPLTRVLTRPKPLKKHSYLILTPSILAAKKAKPRAAPQPPTHVSTPLHPKVLLFTLLLLVST